MDVQQSAAPLLAPSGALTIDGGQALSRPTKSRPFWPPRSPRWILQCLGACDGYVPVQGGVFQVTRVTDPGLGTHVQVEQPHVDLPGSTMRASLAGAKPGVVATSLAEYDTSYQVALETVQAIVRTETRTQALLSDTHDQLQWQLQMACEFIYETKENLIFNHPVHGLLHNVHPRMEIENDGPPTPDVLDELLSHAWRRPDCFLMHPVTLAEFRREATARAITLQEVEIFGSAFSTWRGLPICPTNKLQLLGPSNQPVGLDADDLWRPSSRGDSGARAEMHPRGNYVRGSARTDVLLVRLGHEKQGVVNLYAADVKAHPSFPFVTVEPMSVGDNAVANYLLTTYTAAAVLSPGSLARARVTV